MILRGHPLGGDDIVLGGVSVVGGGVYATDAALRISSIAVGLNGGCPSVAAGRIAASMSAITLAGAEIVGLAGDASLVAVDDRGNDFGGCQPTAREGKTSAELTLRVVRQRGCVWPGKGAAAQDVQGDDCALWEME